MPKRNLASPRASPQSRGFQGEWVDLVCLTGQIPHGHEVAVVKHHVGVGGVLEVAEVGVVGVVGGVIHHPRIDALIRFGVSLISDGVYPTIAIGGGAITKVESVEHSRLRRTSDNAHWLAHIWGWAVANVKTIEVVWDLSDDLEILGSDLGVDRGVSIEKVGVVLSVQCQVEGVITDCGHGLTLLCRFGFGESGGLLEAKHPVTIRPDPNR